MGQNENTDEDGIIEHIKNIKLLQAIHSGKKFYVECYPTDKGAIHFPNSNRAVKEIELPNFKLHAEKLGYAWIKVFDNKKQTNGTETEANVEYPANARAIIDAADKYYIPRYSPKPLTTNIEQALINLEEYLNCMIDIDFPPACQAEINLLNDVLVIKKYFGID